MIVPVPSSTHSFKDLNLIYSQINQILDLLDSSALEELLSGNDRDLDHIFQVFLEEASNVLLLKSSSISRESLDYLPSLSKSLDLTLKRLSYNFFKITVLPNFDMGIHNIEWGNFVQLFSRLCIEAARGLGKSYEFDFAWPLWNLYRFERDTALQRQPLDIKMSREGLTITLENKLATKFLVQIREEIEQNEELRERLYPQNRSDSWGSTGLTCRNGAKWDIKSYGSTVRGHHVGKIAVDDFLSKQVLYSKDQNNKFIEVFDGEIMHALEPWGSIVVIGTPFTYQDLYSQLKKRKDWRVFEYPGILPDGTITNPHRFSLDYYLDLKESQGSMVFSREVLVKPISTQSTIFPFEILEKSFIGTQDLCLVNNRESFPIKFKYVGVGCDFAISGNIGSDYSVFSVWGLDSLENWYLLHLYRERGKSHNEQILAISKINRDFSPDEIICESNGFQQIMSSLAKEHGLKNVVEFKTTGFNKKDLYEGLPSLAALFERGQLKLPRGDVFSRERTDLLISEFNSVTFNEDSGKLESASEHDDIPMSSLFVLKGSKVNVLKKVMVSYI